MIRFRGDEAEGRGESGEEGYPSATGRSRDRPVATEFRIKWVSCLTQRAPRDSF